MDKYYYISFMFGKGVKTLDHDVITDHPSVWARHAHKAYPGQYVLKDWREITKEQYDNFREFGGLK